MRILLAASLLFLALVPAASADPIESSPGPETTVLDTCILDPGLIGWGLDVYYQPIYYGTSDPLPHADGVLLTAGAHQHDC
ncbi:MAG TPA: hypothetical protein VJ874_05310 [Candidatus Thermoplasmatota archaeon]|nr:hypothetical protein [Candidatus Thermoplasmatota archaeon]